MTTEVEMKNQKSSRPFNKKRWRSVGLWVVFLPLVLIVIIPLIYEVSMAFTHESNQL